MNRNCVQGGAAAFQGGLQFYNPNNFDLDPLFLAPAGPDGNPATFADNDYRLPSLSPCVDAGDASLLRADLADRDNDGDLLEALPRDLAGAARRIDDPLTADSGPAVARLAPLAHDLAALVEHARRLRELAPFVRLGFSLPRVQSVDAQCDYRVAQLVDDDDFAKAFLYLRREFPDADLTLTTRESSRLRDALLPLGVTKLSAGVCTAPGGYAVPSAATAAQFSIHDERSRAQVAAAVRAAGLTPV